MLKAANFRQDELLIEKDKHKTNISVIGTKFNPKHPDIKKFIHINWCFKGLGFKSAHEQIAYLGSKAATTSVPPI